MLTYSTSNLREEILEEAVSRNSLLITRIFIVQYVIGHQVRIDDKIRVVRYASAHGSL